jgi:protein-disulfide isomerase
MNKRLIFGIAAVVVILIGLVVFFSQNKEKTESGNSNDPYAIVSDDHVTGSDISEIVLIEYSDFQCPYCALIYPVVLQMEQEFGQDIKFVFRHLPLPSIHKNTMAAHRAAEAASLQDKYFEMAQLIYAHQGDWESAANASSIFETYAQELGLDVAKFNEDVKSQAVYNRIKRDIDSATEIAIPATPAFILNGQLISVPKDIEDLRSTLQEAVNKQSS